MQWTHIRLKDTERTLYKVCAMSGSHFRYHVLASFQQMRKLTNHQHDEGQRVYVLLVVVGQLTRDGGYD